MQHAGMYIDSAVLLKPCQKTVVVTTDQNKPIIETDSWANTHESTSKIIAFFYNNYVSAVHPQKIISKQKFLENEAPGDLTFWVFMPSVYITND